MRSIFHYFKILGLFAVIALASQGSADVSYRLIVDPSSKNIKIRMTINDAGPTEQVSIPAWCPGYYVLLSYEKQISQFRAIDSAGEPLKSTKAGERSWTISNPEKKSTVIVSYQVAGNDAGLGFFGVHIRGNSAFINGPAAFLYSKKRMLEPHRLEVNIPGTWDLATGMNPEAGKSNREFVSKGYDEFVDHPIQLGKFIRRQFTVMGKPFEVVFVSPGEPRCDIDAETKMLERASLPGMKMFGGAPFPRYLYIVHLEVGSFGGGLEHRASTVLATGDREGLGIEDLATHEFFHVWNVKNIRPKILGPFDYSQPNRTTQLWFSEGVTDYYAKIHAYQAGLRSRGWLLDAISNEIEDLQRSEVRKTKTVEQVSKEAWENGGFGVGDLSFYTKGQVIGFLIDSFIRAETAGKKSLDDVFRLMMSRFSLPKPGFTDDDILLAINEVSGKDFTEMYTRCVRTTEELPYELGSRIGVRVILPGEWRVDPFYQTDGNYKVLSMAPNMRDSGLVVGDVIKAAKVVEEDKILLTVLRGNEELSFTVQGRRYRAVDHRIQIDPFASAEARALFRGWTQLTNKPGDTDGEGSSDQVDRVMPKHSHSHKGNHSPAPKE